LSLEGWFQEVAESNAPQQQFERAKAAAARIREIQKRSKPDPDGETVQDYINADRP
jgi:hypothetical protein